MAIQSMPAAATDRPQSVVEPKIGGPVIDTCGERKMKHNKAYLKFSQTDLDLHLTK